MSVMYEIRTLGDPVLRERCHEVTQFDRKLRRLAEAMLTVMDEAEGIGLAASQVGVLKRLFVWRHPETGEPQAFVNPVIVEASDDIDTGTEGCLSVPGYSVEVPRHKVVVVEACDLEGNPLTFTGSDLLARIMQHEIDHLDGTIILDRTSAEERRRVLRERQAKQDTTERARR